MKLCLSTFKAYWRDKFVIVAELEDVSPPTTKCLLQECIVQLCLKKPENPRSFLADYLQNQNSEEAEELRPRSAVSMSVKDDGGAGDDIQEDEDDLMESRAGRSRRQAISAEPINDTDAQNYVKKVIPKDAQTMQRLIRSAGKNFLFMHLEEDERRYLYSKR